MNVEYIWTTIGNQTRTLWGAVNAHVHSCKLCQWTTGWIEHYVVGKIHLLITVCREWLNCTGSQIIKASLACITFLDFCLDFTHVSTILMTIVSCDELGVMVWWENLGWGNSESQLINKEFLTALLQVQTKLKLQIRPPPFQTTNSKVKAEMQWWPFLVNFLTEVRNENLTSSKMCETVDKNKH